MVVIASSTGADGVLQKDIAESQDISVKYLDSIISHLKLKGLIVNAQGKRSGYKLARPSDQITMLDIYTAFERIDVVECLNNENCCPRKTTNCKANKYWHSLKTDFTSLLENKTLSEIM
jgi:Rrf2 family protein